MALDLDPDRVRQAAAAGQSVVFGDAARLQSLMAAGLARASAVVVSYHDTASALKILRLVHEHAPQVPVIVRTHRRHRPRTPARRRRHRGGARGDRRLADAGQPRAGAGGRADAPRDPHRAGRARRALRPAARLLPRRRRRHRATSCSRRGCSASRCRRRPRASASRWPTWPCTRWACRWCRCAGPRAACAKPDDDLALAAGDTLVLSGLPEPLALAEAKLLRV